MERAIEKQLRLRRILQILKKTYPDARLALEYSNPLELLIALILAAQAPDERVNQVTAKLFKNYHCAADWAEEKSQTLQQSLAQIPFYRNKTRLIQKACRMICDNFAAKVPSSLDTLLELPGVGRKTANILLGNAFGVPAIGVDRHVARLSLRLGLTRKTKPDDIERELEPLVPKSQQVNFCHLLQFHGRQICLASKPKCDDCPIRSLCPYPARKGNLGT